VDLPLAAILWLHKTVTLHTNTNKCYGYWYLNQSHWHTFLVSALVM